MAQNPKIVMLQPLGVDLIFIFKVSAKRCWTSVITFIVSVTSKRMLLMWRQQHFQWRNWIINKLIVTPLFDSVVSRELDIYFEMSNLEPNSQCLVFDGEFTSQNSLMCGNKPIFANLAVQPRLMGTSVCRYLVIHQSTGQI